MCLKARAERGEKWLHALGQLVDDLIPLIHDRPDEVIRVAVLSIDVKAHADQAILFFCPEVPVLGRNQDVADPDELAVGGLVVTDKES